MQFPTIQFGLFFPAVFLASWLLRPRPTQWKLFMLGASYFFYASFQKGAFFSWEHWRFPALLMLTTVVNQVIVVGVHQARGPAIRKAWVIVGVTIDVAILGYFKYYNFFYENLTNFALKILPARQVFLPVAISFFIFQALSYVIDAYRDKLKPVRLLDFAVYLSFFPHLVAGPIVRATEFLPQIKVRPDPRYIDGARAFRLIVAGMFKKVVIASFLYDHIVREVISNPGRFSAADVLVGMWAYAIYIYADFSGYTDIAIGLALLLGIEFPRNFDSPYIARSLQDFWRRWHMTLSRWLRDYLYIGLGGNRKRTLFTYRNLMLTMVIGGLWHGANWNFVVWGAIHGGGLALERFLRDRRATLGIVDPPDNVLWRVGRWFVTFNVVCVAWVFFGVGILGRDVGASFDVLSRLVHLGPVTIVTPMVLFVVAIMLASQFVPEGFMRNVQTAFSHVPLVAQGLVLAFSFMVIDALGPQGVLPFIYQQF